jgi:hypothetical protein
VRELRDIGIQRRKERTESAAAAGAAAAQGAAAAADASPEQALLERVRELGKRGLDALVQKIVNKHLLYDAGLPWSTARGRGT